MSNPKYTERELADVLRRLSLELGRVPTPNEINAAGPPRYRTIVLRLGGSKHSKMHAAKEAAKILNDVAFSEIVEKEIQKKKHNTPFAEYCRKHNIRLCDLQKMTGISKTSIQDYLSGKTDITSAKSGNVKKIADALEISVDDLLKL